MSMTAALLQEFDNEATTTRRVLERVPNDKLAWKPHPKSMSLGVLALHVAGSPAAICGWAAEDETHFKGEPSPMPRSIEILAAHDQGVTTSKEILGRLGDDGLKKVVRVPSPARRRRAANLRAERRREPVRTPDVNGPRSTIRYLRRLTGQWHH